MEPHHRPNDLRLLSPEFQPRPGWGGRLASWCRHSLATWLVRLFIIIVLPFAIADMGYRISRELWPAPSPADSAPQETAVVVPVKPGEGVTHAARLALYEYLATRPLPPQLAPEQFLYAVDWMVRQMPLTAPAPGQEISFSYELLDRATAGAQALTPAQRAAWSRYVK